MDIKIIVTPVQTALAKRVSETKQSLCSL